MTDLPLLQVLGTGILVVLYSLLLWRAYRALAPSRKGHDLIRTRRLAAFIVMWLTSVALFVGALGVDGDVPIEVSRLIYAALRAVMFIVGLAIVLSWSPAGMADSPDEDERRR